MLKENKLMIFRYLSKIKWEKNLEIFSKKKKILITNRLFKKKLLSSSKKESQFPMHAS